MEQPNKFHEEDKVRVKGGYSSGVVTGFNGTSYRIWWNSTNDMHYSWALPEHLELVECKHNG